MSISPINNYSFGTDFLRRNSELRVFQPVESQAVSEIVRAQVTQEMADILNSAEIPARSGRAFETGRAQDVSLNGNGFFGLRLGDSDVFSRSVSLGLDSLGNVTDTISGSLLLEQVNSDEGVTTEPFQLTPSQRAILSSPSNAIALAGNLSSDIEIGQSISRSVQLFDTNGNPTELAVDFQRMDDNQFRIQFTDPNSGEVVLGTRLNFDPNSGTLSNSEGDESDVESDTQLTLEAESGENLVIQSDDISFDGLTLEGDETDLSINQVGGESGLELEGLTLNENGQLVGQFGEQERIFGRVAIGEFSDPSSLNDVGNSLLTPTHESGNPQFSEQTPDPDRFQPGSLELFSGLQTRNVINNFLQDGNFISRRRAILQDRGELLGDVFDVFG